MIGRLLGALALVLVLAGLVLLPAAPASACSCVTDQPEQYLAQADFAFSGVLRSQRADGHDIAQRFVVEAVSKGEIHRTQDVVTPNLDRAGCGIGWGAGAELVVLGHVDEEGHLASNLCSGSAATTDPSYDAMIAALGTGSEPLPGRSVVELSVSSRKDVRWFTLAVGVIGLAAVALQVVRRRRGRARS